MDICIIGGGIAGLSFAGFLNQNDFEPTVVEQAEEWKRVGWGIGLWGTGVEVLKELGVAETALENGTEMSQYQLRNGRGEEIASYNVETEGLEFLAVHRADLHGALRESVPQESIRMNTRPEEVNEKEEKVEVVFDDGTAEAFDLVIGADGMHSKVREECFEGYEVKEQGIAVWSFWTDAEKLPEGTTSIWTAGTEAFLTDINGRGLANIATRVDSPEDIEPPAEEKLQEVAESIGWKLPDIVNERDRDDFFCDTIKTVKTDNWTSGRVALMGDAAHALNPIVGMGASLALEDAYVLAEEIEENEDMEEALESYEGRRRKPVNSVRRKASVMEWIVFNDHSIIPYIGNAVLKHTSSLADRYYQNMSVKGLEDI